MVLHAKSLENGLLELSIESERRQSVRQIVAANEFLLFAAMHCDSQIFPTFFKGLRAATATPVTLDAPAVEEIAHHFGLIS